jgi:hypothetical protein
MRPSLSNVKKHTHVEPSGSQRFFLLSGSPSFLKVSVILIRFKKSVKRNPHFLVQKADFFQIFFPAKEKLIRHTYKSGINCISWDKIVLLDMSRQSPGRIRKFALVRG